MKATILVLLSVFIFNALASAQEGGPPPFARERAKQNQEKESPEGTAPPFVKREKIAQRFQKEFGVKPEIYNKIAKMVTDQMVHEKEEPKDGEPKSEASPSVLGGNPHSGSNVTSVLLLTLGKVRLQEAAGKLKQADRESNLVKAAQSIITHLKNNPTEGFGALPKEAGLTDAGELLALKRSVEWEQPIEPSLKKKLGF